MTTVDLPRIPKHVPDWHAQGACQLEPGRWPLLPRFVAKVRIGAPDECWEWTAARRNGYGVIGVNGNTMRAHRVSVMLTGRALTEDEVVRHTCDNPPCVNPRHLLVGTLKDNTGDMLARGRHRTNPARGERNGNVKLTNDQVIAIRRRRANGETNKSLAAEFGISKNMVSFIVTRRFWRHLP